MWKLRTCLCKCIIFAGDRAITGIGINNSINISNSHNHSIDISININIGIIIIEEPLPSIVVEVS